MAARISTGGSAGSGLTFRTSSGVTPPREGAGGRVAVADGKGAGAGRAGATVGTVCTVGGAGVGAVWEAGGWTATGAGAGPGVGKESLVWAMGPAVGGLPTPIFFFSHCGRMPCCQPKSAAPPSTVRTAASGSSRRLVLGRGWDGSQAASAGASGTPRAVVSEELSDRSGRARR